LRTCFTTSFCAKRRQDTTEIEGSCFSNESDSSTKPALKEVFLSGAYDNDPKILVSTALGVDGGNLTDAMEFGNTRRLMD
jgi:hypothetical protein